VLNFEEQGGFIQYLKERKSQHIYTDNIAVVIILLTTKLNVFLATSVYHLKDYIIHFGYDSP